MRISNAQPVWLHTLKDRGITNPYLQGGGCSFRETAFEALDEKYREGFQNFLGGGGKTREQKRRASTINLQRISTPENNNILTLKRKALRYAAKRKLLYMEINISFQ